MVELALFETDFVVEAAAEGPVDVTDELSVEETAVRTEEETELVGVVLDVCNVCEVIGPVVEVEVAESPEDEIDVIAADVTIGTKDGTDVTTGC
jgi:hypothetical protein